MFDVCIKHMNKVFECYQANKVQKDHKFVTSQIIYMFNMRIKYVFMF